MVSEDSDNSPLTHYGWRDLKNDDIFYMSLHFRTMENERNVDGLQIEEYIKGSMKNWHRTGNELSEQDVIDYTFDGEVDTENFTINNPYILYFEGSDDGHFYIRFPTETSRLEFVEKFKKMSFEEIEEVVYPSETLSDIMVFRDN